jgi:hypothetical protein
MQNPFENEKFINDLEKLLVKYDVNDWVCLPVRIVVEYIFAVLKLFLCAEQWKEERDKRCQ